MMKKRKQSPTEEAEDEEENNDSTAAKSSTENKAGTCTTPKSKSKPKPITTSHGSRRQHLEVRRNLPVYKFRNEICKLVSEKDVLLVIAETVRIYKYILLL